MSSISARPVPFWRKYRGTLAGMAILSLLAFAGAAFTPSLMGDEWAFLGAHLLDTGYPCPDWSTPRLLSGCLHRGFFHLFGPNVYAWHALAVPINFLSAVCLLFILEQLLPGHPTFNGSTAALFLVYPADLTRTWIGGSVVYGAGLTLVAGCFFAWFYRHGRWWAWLVSMVVLILALMTYEISLGLVFAVSSIAFLVAGHRPLAWRLGLFAPALFAAAFAIVRWIWQQAVGTAYGHSLDEVQLSPAVLVTRFGRGLQITLQQSWAETVQELLDPALSSSSAGRLVAGLLPLGLVGLMIVLGYAVSRSSRNAAAGTDEATIRPQRATIVRLLLGGVVVLIAGYIPVITVLNPRTVYPFSRIHYLPSIGAAVILCAALFSVASMLGQDAAARRRIALAGLFPLLALGVAAHLHVQSLTRAAWADQKLLWQAFFEQVPALEPGTHVLFILNRYGQPSRGPKPLISGDEGMSNALAILYGDTTLQGHFTIAWPPRVLSADGDELVVTNVGERRYPAAETLVYVFDRETKRLERLPALEKDGGTLSLGDGRILSGPPRDARYRWLVERELR